MSIHNRFNPSLALACMGLNRFMDVIQRVILLKQLVIELVTSTLYNYLTSWCMDRKRLVKISN